MRTYKYEIHGTRDSKPFYSTFVVESNPNLDPNEPPLIIKAAGHEKVAWSFEEVYGRAARIYESIGVENVDISDSRF